MNMTHLNCILSTTHHMHSPHVLSFLQSPHLLVYFKKTFWLHFLAYRRSQPNSISNKTGPWISTAWYQSFSIPILYIWVFASAAVTALRTDGFIELSTITSFSTGWFQLLRKYLFMICFKYFLHCASPFTCQHQVSSAIVQPKTFPNSYCISQTSVTSTTVFTSSAKFEIWDAQHFFHILKKL